MYFCPDCKAPLGNLRCPSCKVQFDRKDGFPVLFSRHPQFQSSASMGSVYDDIYAHRASVWEDQGRTPEFIDFFSNLLEQFSDTSILEVGCGEGFLLSKIRATQKFAIDLSVEALRNASGRTQAEFSMAMAERLPFASGYFDLVTSVGVMEHFLDDREATKEIFRVLKPGGYYVALLHVHLSVFERFQQKTAEYIYPRFRPIGLAKWISSKIIRPISQPIQRPYTRHTAQNCIEDSGFAIEQIISKRTHPNAPLIGPHVLAFVARKH
jgi:SAM-dependent methyltransferase